MKILLTGGAGFIGSHLSDLLINKGHSVICMDNLITGKKDNIKHLLDNSDFKFIEYDITEHITLDEKIDYVLHFASPASPVDYLKYPIKTLKVGSLGTHNALGVAKKYNAKFLLASTSEVYGDPSVSPQPETYYGNVNCIGPRGVYDEAKRFAEAITLAYHKKHKMDAKIVRIFNTYGERIRKRDGRAIPNFIDQALKNKPLTIYGDGSQTRSFCYVSDLIAGVYKLMHSNLNTPVNLGNPAELSILQLAEKIIALSNSKSKIEYNSLPADDPKIRKPDITKARTNLNWHPKVNLEDGLNKLISWMQK